MYLILDYLNILPKIYGHKKKGCLEQNISIGSHCMELGNFMLHFTTFHNVS